MKLQLKKPKPKKSASIQAEPPDKFDQATEPSEDMDYNIKKADKFREKKAIKAWRIALNNIKEDQKKADDFKKKTAIKTMYALSSVSKAKRLQKEAEEQRQREQEQRRRADELRRAQEQASEERMRREARDAAARTANEVEMRRLREALVHEEELTRRLLREQRLRKNAARNARDEADRAAHEAEMSRLRAENVVAQSEAAAATARVRQGLDDNLAALRQSNRLEAAMLPARSEAEWCRLLSKDSHY